MTNAIYDANDALTDLVDDVTLDELLQLKLENPGEADWYDDLILAKKDQIGITNLGMTWGVQITCRGFSFLEDTIIVNNQTHSMTVLTTNHCNQTTSSKTIQHLPITNTQKQSSLSPLSNLIGTQWNE